MEREATTPTGFRGCCRLPTVALLLACEACAGDQGDWGDMDVLVYRLEKDGDLRRVWKAGQSGRTADGSMRTSITGCLCRMTSGYTYFSITTMHGPIAAPAQIEECTGTRRGNHFGVPAGSLSVECLRHRGQGMGFKPGAGA